MAWSTTCFHTPARNLLPASNAATPANSLVIWRTTQESTLQKQRHEKADCFRMASIMFPLNYLILLTGSFWCLVFLTVFIFKLFSTNKKYILIETKISYSQVLEMESLNWGGLSNKKSILIETKISYSHQLRSVLELESLNWGGSCDGFVKVFWSQCPKVHYGLKNVCKNTNSQWESHFTISHWNLCMLLATQVL